MDIQRRISQLPQELQDTIYSYSVEHRQMMKYVCEEIDDVVNRVECGNRCGYRLSKLEDTEYTENLFGIEILYCSSWCMIDHSFDCRDMRRQARKLKRESLN